jgi:hypothetical protein
VIALVYLPVSMFIMPLPMPYSAAVAPVDPSATTASLAAAAVAKETSSASTTKATVSSPSFTPALPEHHPADVRRIAEMQNAIVRRGDDLFKYDSLLIVMFLFFNNRID